MIRYWKLCCSNECVEQEAFKGAKGGFLWSLRCTADILRWQEELRGLSWCLRMDGIFSSGTGEFIDRDVAVADGIVIGVGTYKGEREIDLEGKVICRVLLIVICIWNLPW